MNTMIIILLVVLAIAVVLLFAICGFLFNQVIWYKLIKLPTAKAQAEGMILQKITEKPKKSSGKCRSKSSRLRHRTAKKYMRACSCPRRATAHDNRLPRRTAQGYANSASPRRTFTAWVIHF